MHTFPNHLVTAGALTALVLAGLALALPAPAAVETVQVPLVLPEVPLFLGGDGYDVAVELPFDAQRPLAGMTGAAVYLKGSGDFHRSICWQFGGYGGGVVTHREDEGLTATLKVGSTVIAEAALIFAPEDYPDLVGVNYDTVLVFPDCDLSALAAGTGVIVLEGLDCEFHYSYPTVCICDPSAGVTLATFVAIFDDQVPAEPTAWGAVKARYR